MEVQKHETKQDLFDFHGRYGSDQRRPSRKRWVTIDLVHVGNPGNPPDLRYNLDERPEGFGAVDYEYSIGKYEVTNIQWREFLNAKAAVGDPYGLYDAAMGEQYGGHRSQRVRHGN